MRAVREQEVEVVEKLLKGYRFFVYDFDNNMKTALHHAAYSNDLDMIKVLMENGSDLDSRDMSNYFHQRNSWAHSIAFFS